MKNRFPLLLGAAVTAALLTVPAIADAKIEGKVVIFHAGSLTVPFAEIEKAFEALHPGVDVQREAGGSTKMARMISEVGKPADIMASADYAVIDKILIPKHASWNIRFATNQLVLCYTDQSRFAGEVNGDTWTDVLGRDGVVWGHSDPNLDPCGYRSLMVLQLAEQFYGKKGLYADLIAKRKKEWVAAEIRRTGLAAEDREHGLCLGVSFRRRAARAEVRHPAGRDQPGRLPA